MSTRVTRSSTRDKNVNTNANTTTTSDSTSPNENNTANNNNPGLSLTGKRKRKPTNTTPPGESKISNTNPSPDTSSTTTNIDVNSNNNNNTTTINTTTTTVSDNINNNTNNANHTNTTSPNYILTTHENLEPNSLSNSSSSVSTIIDVTESATNTPPPNRLPKIPSNITSSIQTSLLTDNPTIVQNTLESIAGITSVNTRSLSDTQLQLQFTLEDEKEFSKRVDEELKDILIFTPPSSPEKIETDDERDDEKPIPADCMEAVAAFDSPILINPKRPIRILPEPPHNTQKKKSTEEMSIAHERFLLAGFSELRNLETELYTREIIARLESQVFAFYQSILRRDSLIKKLIKDIEERDLIIQSIPKELLVNWGVLANLQKKQ